MTVPALMVLFAASSLDADQLARYTQANADIQAGRYSEAVGSLNALAAQQPKVAEIFAARCSALVGLKNYPAAEADCRYALQVKPQLAAALYGLAIAEDRQGKGGDAVAHYRQYAALDATQAPLRGRADARATELSGAGSSPVVPAGAGSSTAGFGRLVIYVNHLFAAGRRMLVLDGKLVGDLSMDQYVQIDATYGEHLFEVREYPKSIYDLPRTWSRPVQVSPTPSYLSFETGGGGLVLVDVPAGQALKDIRSDCKLAYTRQITAGSAPAPVQQQAVAPGVVVAPGVGYYGVVSVGAAPVVPVYRGRSCRFSSDCGEGIDFSCRDWHGQQTCMGHGWRGDPCWFGSDCESGSCDGNRKVCR